MAAMRPIGYWLKLLDRLIDEQFDAIVEEHGVTRRQWQLMNLLLSRPAGRDQLESALAPFVVTDEPDSTLDQLTELVDSGWVSLIDESYALTERGRTSFGRLGEVVGRTRTVLSEGITEQEYTATIGVLERMARNLGWDDSTGTRSQA